MRTWIFNAAALALLLVPPAATAADTYDAAACAKLIAPFVDDEAILVARLDIKQINLDAIVEQIRQIVPLPIEDGGLDLPKAALSGFLTAGGSEVYFVVSLRDLQQMPLVVAPIGENGDAAAIQKTLRQWSSTTTQIGNVVVAGNSVVVERARTNQAKKRPELAAAFAATSDGLLQVLLLPTDDNRRVVEQLMPNFPPQFGGGPTTTVTHGLSWLALTVKAPPQIAVRLTAQSPDAKAAQQLADLWSKGLEVMRTDPQLQKLLPAAASLAAALLKPTVRGDQMLVAVDEQNQGGKLMRELLKPALTGARQAAARTRSMNSMKQIGLALHNYLSDHKDRFPAAYSVDAQGKPLLSWRVMILPYLDHEALYKQFHLDEPWDSDHNKPLIAKMPAVYAGPASLVAKEGKTVFLTIRGEGTIFPGKEGVEIRDIRDGTSNTIMLVEVNDQQAVEWTKPDDLKFDPEKPKAGLGGQYDGVFNIALADGSVRTVKLDIAADTLRALVTRNGGEVPDDY